jgi:hypothetical protein
MVESLGSFKFSISSSLRERRGFRNLFLNFSMPILRHLTSAGEPCYDVRWRRTVSVEPDSGYRANRGVSLVSDYASIDVIASDVETSEDASSQHDFTLAVKRAVAFGNVSFIGGVFGELSQGWVLLYDDV